MYVPKCQVREAVRRATSDSMRRQARLLRFRQRRKSAPYGSHPTLRVDSIPPVADFIHAFGVILALTDGESFFFDFCVSDFIVQMISNDNCRYRQNIYKLYLCFDLIFCR